MLDALHRDVTWATLEQSMRGLREEATAIANNVANVDTPQYKRHEIDFRTGLREALEETGDRASRSSALRGSAIEDFEIGGEEMLNDGNSVDLFHEMKLSAQNSLDTAMSYSLMQKKLRIYKMVIRDGR